MPSGQKRIAKDEAGPTTRAKAAKTDGSDTAKHAGPRTSAKKGREAAGGVTAFEAHALPLHVNITHTPPVVDDDSTELAQIDPGFIGSATLVPSSSRMGSYGWKGTKRITVELLNDESGEKKKVPVMLTINATVLGNKNTEDEPNASAGATEVDDKLEGEDHVRRKGAARGHKV